VITIAVAVAASRNDTTRTDRKTADRLRSLTGRPG
jgi:hypothetical protein